MRFDGPVKDIYQRGKHVNFFQVAPFDGEAFVPVVGLEDFYEVSNLGRVRSKERVCPSGKSGNTRTIRPRIMRLYRTKSGYWHVGLRKLGEGRSRSLHRIMAEAFLDKPLGAVEVNHKDGDKGNCSLDNLEWVSRRENVIHAYKNGLMEKVKMAARRGSLHFNSVLTEQIAADVYIDPRPIAEIARVYGVSESCIRNVKKGRTWVHVTREISHA